MKTKLTWMLTPILALLMSFSYGQEKTIKGNVTDHNGLPLPGVSVLVVGTVSGTQTDFDGNYTIKADVGQTLRYSYVGQKTTDRKVGAATTINVQMDEDAQALEEVIVTGFGNVSKTSYAGSAKVVGGENISKKSFTNVSQALAGEAAGVAVFNTSGQPGSTSTVRIRGFGSINGSQAPLYIVDDAPFAGSLNDINPNDIKSVTILKDASSTSLYGARGSNGVVVITTKKGKGEGSKLEISVKTGTNFQGIGRQETIKSPEEFIGIAWEGMFQRGMLLNNGNQAAAVDYANLNLFEGNAGGDDRSDISPIYNMWNVGSDSAGVSQLIDPATGRVRPGVSRRYTPESWEDFAFQGANRLEGNISLSNSGENSSVRTSIGFIDDVGYASNTDYQRLNARISATNRFKDFITMTSSLNYAQAERNDNGTGSSSSSQFWWIDNLPTIYPLFRKDANGNNIPDPIYGGSLFDYGLEDGRGFGFATNGVADSQINISQNKDNSVNFNNDIKITLVEGLTLENNFAYQYFMRDNIDLNEPFYSPANGDGGVVTRSRAETKNYTIRTGFRYTKTFGNLNLNALLTHVATEYEYNFLSAQRSKLVTPFGPDIRNGIINEPSDGLTRNDKTESYIANVNLDFSNKYIINLAFNRDASSKFLDNPWGNFYSVGAAWVLSQEDFLSNSSFIDFLKFKASYGVLGNSGYLRGGANYYYPGYTRFDVNNVNDNISLRYSTTAGAPNLTWENSNQTNLGLEFELGGFVDGSVEVYRKTTTDMFFNRSAGPSNAFDTFPVNDGEMWNSGLEFDLDFKLVQNDKFSLNFGINGALLDNELVRMPIDPSTGELQVIDTSGRFGRAEGRSLYDYYMPAYAGVNPATGAAMWERSFNDVDGNGVFGTGDESILNLTDYMAKNPNATIVQDITEVYAEATDKFVNKTAIPDISGSFRLNARYGGFSLSTLFNYALGGYGYDSAYASLMDNDLAGTNNFHVDIRDRWKAPGDVTNIPRQDSRTQLQQNSTSTRFLTKLDHLALSNVRLGFDLPRDITKQIGLTKLDFFVTADNLALFSKRQGFNPSTSVTGSSSVYNFSPLTTIVLGVNINL